MFRPSTSGKNLLYSSRPLSQTSSCAQIPAVVSAAGNGMAFVTVALSINIISNGIYATSRCSSPTHGPSTSHNANNPNPSALPLATASVTLKLSQCEAGTMANHIHPPGAGGGNGVANSTPSSSPGPVRPRCSFRAPQLLYLVHILVFVYVMYVISIRVRTS